MGGNPNASKLKGLFLVLVACVTTGLMLFIWTQGGKSE